MIFSQVGESLEDLGLDPNSIEKIRQAQENKRRHMIEEHGASPEDASPLFVGAVGAGVVVAFERPAGWLALSPEAAIHLGLGLASMGIEAIERRDDPGAGPKPTLNS